MAFLLIREAIKLFIEDREFKNLSPFTIKTYRITLNIFCDYCVSRGIVEIDNLSPRTTKSFLMYCKNELNNLPTSINQKLRTLKAFIKFLAEEEYLEDDKPVIKIKKVKEFIKIEVLTDDQINKILKHLKRFNYRANSFVTYRNRFLFIFLISTGCRRGEVVNIRWSDIDLENQTIRICGKKRKIASIPFTKKLKREILEYKSFLIEFLSEEPIYLFPSGKNTQLSDEAISSFFKSLKKEMNFEEVRLSCHTLRHTFAHRCITSGMDITVLKNLMLHENISQTEKYLALWGIALNQENEKFNPLNNIDI